MDSLYLGNHLEMVIKLPCQKRLFATVRTVVKYKVFHTQTFSNTIW
jgi:hypothetical protein